MAGLAQGSFFNGVLHVEQDPYGYRFSLDAVILAHSIRPAAGDRILDLGTGCGIIPLILAYRFSAVSLFGVEIQPSLAAAARANARVNGMDRRIHILCCDFKQLPFRLPPAPMDWVVSNPPYYPVRAGRVNPDSQRAIARHEVCAALPDVAAAAARHLQTGGRFAVIYPAERTVDLTGAMRDAGIEPKQLRFVHSQGGTPAKMVVAVGRKRGRPGVHIAPPLNVYHANGNHTDEMAKMLAP